MASLPTPCLVGIFANMKAKKLLKERFVLSPVAFAEVVVWQLPEPVAASVHHFKYRLALVVNGECVLRYDNEAGKGDHKHVGGDEIQYEFTSIESLVDDFWRDAEKWR